MATLRVTCPQRGGRQRRPFLHHLDLRPLGCLHLPAYVSLTAEPGLARVEPRPGGRSRQAVARSIVQASQRGWHLRRTGLWVATPGSNRRAVIGICGLNWIASLRRFELFFCLDARFRGRGITTACMAALLDHADRQGVRAPMFALTDPANRAAQQVLRSIGFACRGSLPMAGRPRAYFVRP